jgi:hypothetical protein
VRTGEHLHAERAQPADIGSAELEQREASSRRHENRQGCEFRRVAHLFQHGLALMAPAILRHRDDGHRDASRQGADVCRQADPGAQLRQLRRANVDLRELRQGCQGNMAAAGREAGEQEAGERSETHRRGSSDL